MNSKKAWSASGIAWLSVFFSFIPGGILYAYNAEKFGQVKSKYVIIWPIVGLMIFLITLAILEIPANLDYKDVFKAVNIIFALVFYFSQKAQFEEFIAKDGTKASFKMPIIYSLIFVVIQLVFYFLPGAAIELKSDRVFENKQISVEIPENWEAVRNYEEDVLVEVLNSNGMGGNMSIDKAQYFLEKSNLEAIQDFSPKELLIDTFKSIEHGTKNFPAEGWTNFKITEPVTELELEGYKAARGSFSVDENVLGEGKLVNRTITRILIFTDKDIYNIVFAPTDTVNYKEEEKDFKKFLESLEIK